MKKVLFLEMVLMILGSALVFAGGGKEQSSSTALTYWGQPGKPNKELIALFNERMPDVRIDLVEVPELDMRESLMTAMSSGDGPDIFYYEIGLADAQPLYDNEMIVKLDDAAKKYGWDKKLVSFGIQEATHRGTLWAMPNETEFWAWFYNKKILEEIGVDVPKTWSDVVAIAKKTTAKGYRPFVQGDLEKWPGLFRIAMGYQWSEGGRDAVAETCFGNGSFDTPDFVAGLETMLLLDKAYFPDAPQVAYEEGKAMFLEGKVAIFPMGSWLASNIVASGHAEDFGVMLPIVPGSTSSTVSGASSVGGVGSGWYINADCKNIPAALEFLDVAASDEAQELFVKAGFLPVTNTIDVHAVEGVSEIIKELAQIISDYGDEMGYFFYHFLSAEQNEWFNNGYQAMLSGEITAKDFTRELQELWIKNTSEGFTN